MRQSRKTLIITAILFATPVLIAVLMHQFPGVIQFTGSKNHGNLIQPARPVDTLKITDGSKTYDKAALEGRWTYVVFSQNRCDQACSERLYKTRQVRHALGKDMDRAQRLLITLDSTAMPDQQLLDAHKDMLVTSAEDFPIWQSLFQVDTGKPSDALIDHIYLIDPLGNLMMFYPKTLEGRFILKDLQQLVKVSWIKPK